MSAALPSATLKPKEERRLMRGHLWAYRNEFKQLPELEDGALCDVFAENRRFVGRGFYQAAGGIAVRVLSRRQERIYGAWLAERIAVARKLRQRLFPGSACYRWVFGESDGLPGFVADRYASVVVAESSCAFYRPHAEDLGAAFMASEGVRGVRLRFAETVTDIGEIPAEAEVELEGLSLRVDLAQTQKTGLYLDQRTNHRVLLPFVRGARVFDGHCYHGQWACHAARGGAEQVTAVDTSAAALRHAEANAERNGVRDRCHFVAGDVEEQLRQGRGTYGVIVLDPPGLAKSRGQVRTALPKYRRMNAAALTRLRDGGVLVSCSCSHFVDTAAFLDMLKQAAVVAKRRVQLLELRGAAPDHPVLLTMPETAYLKCAVLRVTG